MANQGALLPATPERDWEALEQRLMKQFDEIIPVGASRGRVEILGPEDGDGGDTSRGNAKKSPQLSPTIFGSSKPLTEQPFKLKSVSEVAKSPLTPTPSSSSRLYEKPSSSPKKPQPTSLHHISDIKSPSKVTYVAPPLISVRAQDVNFEVGHLSFHSLDYSIFVRIMPIVYWMISISPMTSQIDTPADIKDLSFYPKSLLSLGVDICGIILPI